MVCKITSIRGQRRRALGTTLVEFVIASGLGVVMLGSIASLWGYSCNNFGLMFNYVDLDNKSKLALDRFSQQVRGVNSLKSFATNQVTFVDFDGLDLTFAYDPAQRTLTQSKSNVSTILLTECDSLQFSIFQRNPIGGSYDQYPAGNTNACKLVQVQWTCSRAFWGRKATTESVKSAKIVIRRF